VSTAEGNKAVVERFCRMAFVEHDLSGLDGVMRDDYIQHNADVPQGKEGFRRFFEVTFRAMPDFAYEVLQTVADGDLVMVRSVCSGTHTGGEWLGRTPTGNRLEFEVVDVFRLEDGKIAEHWDVADTFTLFWQLGVIERTGNGP